VQGAALPSAAIALLDATSGIRQPLWLWQDPASGAVSCTFEQDPPQGAFLWGCLPAIYPEWLGSRDFCVTHNVRFPYIVGEMANGIATAAMVIAAARAGVLGFFGAAGLSPARVDGAIDEIQRAVGPDAVGSNLIHSPNEPDLEAAIVELYLRRGVPRVSASAYMALSPHVVHYALHGLTLDAAGQIQRRTHVFAKISRPEVARQFMAPAPAEMIAALRDQGKITEAEARLAPLVAVAEDITVEADSGGHTDNRPLTALLPIVLGLRDEIGAHHGYARPVRVGAAGGIGTPGSVAGAFALGAAYVMTGSINQAAVESGLSPHGKQLLANADVADVVMAPAADMFEMGVKVQVLKRGTMFAPRAARLYQCYDLYDSLDAIPTAERTRLEREIFQQPMTAVWDETRRFFAERDPAQLDRAATDARHQMALVFRWYLGLSSHWAIAGTPERKMDLQIWCGPAMGAFNAWVAGSFLEALEERTVAQIAFNMLEGAAVITRAQQLRSAGVPVPDAAFHFAPRRLQP
jgi:trans-AT polyketide synthase, acyltransferase and oxidoreductase domains